MVLNGVIFVPDRNKPGRKDMTGAFLPEAVRFATAIGGQTSWIIPINVGKTRRSREKAVIAGIQKAYEERGQLDVVAFFCHGYRYRLQMGFGTRFKVDRVWLGKLAATIAATSAEDVSVPLYACSAATSAKNANDQTAAGDGGFADELRDALCREGATWNTVIGHSTAGHTTRNPYVRVFQGEGTSTGGIGGCWIARPGGPLWKRWVRWMRTGTNRYQMTQMSLQVIRGKI